MIFLYELSRKIDILKAPRYFKFLESKKNESYANKFIDILDDNYKTIDSASSISERDSYPSAGPSQPKQFGFSHFFAADQRNANLVLDSRCIHWQQKVQILVDDQRIKLRCFGDCGSEINRILTSETNLKVFKQCEQPPRLLDIRCGKELRKYFEKLKFQRNPHTMETKVCKLMIEHMQYIAQKVSMGYLRNLSPPKMICTR